MFEPLGRIPTSHMQRLAGVKTRGDDGKFGDTDLAPPSTPEVYGLDCTQRRRTTCACCACSSTKVRSTAIGSTRSAVLPACLRTIWVQWSWEAQLRLHAQRGRHPGP